MQWTLFTTLFRKDLTRVRRKPLAYLVNICIPLFMTAIVGFVFSPSSDNNTLGVIRMAIVDEDDSVVGQLLSEAVTNPEFQENIRADILGREAAMAALLDNKISAVLVIPERFSEQFVTGENVPPLELVKNPAHRYHPAVIEELLGVVVEGANALHRIAGEDLVEWQEVIDETGVPDMTRIAGLMLRLGDRFDIAGELLFPPLVQFESTNEATVADVEGGEDFNIFGFILPGMAGLFLFFIADNIIRDIYREEKARTLNRYRNFKESLVPFMASKMSISMLVISFSMLLTFLVGILVFGMGYNRFLWILLYTVVYSFFVTGFLLFLNAMAGTESRAETVNSIIIFGMSFLGGNMVPSNQMPEFITQYISRYLPNHWFIRGMHHIQFGWDEVNLAGYSLLMLGIGFLLMCLGSGILHSKLERNRL